MQTRYVVVATLLLAAALPGGPALADDAAPKVDGQTYAVRVREAQTRADEIHAQVRRLHDKLAAMEAQWSGDLAGAARAEVTIDNELSGAFVLTSARVFVDDRLALSRDEAGGVDPKTIAAYIGPIAAGDHVVRVVLAYQGNGTILTYLRGYTFELKSSHAFTASPGKTVAVTTTAFERGGPTTPFEQRPAIVWSEQRR